MNNETAATKLDESNKQVFSEEMLAKIAEAEAYMEEHPNEWVTSEELFTKLNRIVNNEL